MAHVATVRGSVDTSSLGPTLMHEHVFILNTELNLNYPRFSWGGTKQQTMADAAARLSDVRARGIRTIVDLTAVGLGRSIPNIQAVNELVDLHIIVSTGLYTIDELPSFMLHRPGSVHPPTADVLEEMFVADIVEGIADTGVKAGMIKCCTDTPGVTPSIDRVLRAAARAHRATGVPISTHTNAPLRTGLDQQRVFAEEGVDLGRVVIGHCGDTTDLDYLRRLMDAGSTIGMDRFGYDRDDQPSFDERVTTVARLCELGYADRMVLSHDATCRLDNPFLQRDLPKWVFTHVSDDVLPALRARGVSDEDIDSMLRANPRRLFERQGCY